MKNKRISRRITSPKTTSSQLTPATDQVLQIYELAQHILGYLDVSVLLSCHLVCKGWYEVISTSCLLQQYLYFQPCHPKDKITPKQPQGMNPLLVKHFQPLFTFRDTLPWLGHRQLMVPNMSITNMKNGRKVHEAFTRRGATWRKMLVSQPPITTVGYIRREGWPYECSFLSFPDGLRMGELYDIIFEAIWINADKASTMAYVALPFGNEWLEEVAARSMCQPTLFVISQNDLYANRRCGNRQCSCSDYKWRQDGRCRVLRDEFLRKRGRKATRWMFECQDFEEGKFSYDNLKRNTS